MSPRSRRLVWLPLLAVTALALGASSDLAGACSSRPSTAKGPKAKSCTTEDTTTTTTTTTTTPTAPESGALLVDAFDGADGLVTNEYAHWNPGAKDAVKSDVWALTSGSLLRRNSMGWTGVPDDRAPDATSSTGTNSAVFRLITHRDDFGDVAVSFALVHHGFVTTDSTPAVAWDGVHVLLRYQSEESLYYVSVNRRDGAIVIKKKVPGGPSNGGTYHTLASGKAAFTVGAVQRVEATVMTEADGSVTISLVGSDGRTLLRASDTGVGGPPITAAGRIGIRGDNSELSLDDLTVTAR
jgi:hypothetical protein